MSKTKSMWNQGCALLLENADTKAYNNYHTKRIYQKNKLMAMNRFKWEGLNLFRGGILYHFHPSGLLYNRKHLLQ